MTASKRKKGFRTSPSVNPWLAFCGTIPALLSIIIFGVLPACTTIAMSFTDYDGNWATAEFVGLENFVNFFTVLRTDVFSYLWNTLRYALYTIIPMQILAISAALLVNRNFFGRSFFRALFFLPNILGSTVVALVWKLMFDPTSGPFAQLLAAFGNFSAFFGDPDISLWLISIVQLWAGFGFQMTIYLAGLQGISRDYYEAAEIDGANGWRLFWNITLPLLRPSMTICLWMVISGALGMSDLVLLITGGNYNTKTFAFYLYDITMGNKMNQGQISALNLYFFAITTTIMLTYNHFFRKKEVEL